MLRLIGAFESPARAPVSSKMTIRGRGAAFFSSPNACSLGADWPTGRPKARGTPRFSEVPSRCSLASSRKGRPSKRRVERRGAQGEGTGHTRASVERAPSPCRRLGGGFTVARWLAPGARRTR